MIFANVTAEDKKNILEVARIHVEAANIASNPNVPVIDVML